MSEQMFQQIRSELPNLRRYGRAITGQQSTADCAVIMLMQKYAGRNAPDFEADGLRLALYRELSTTLSEATDGTVQTPNSRRAHFLTEVQRFTFAETGHILNVSEGDARDLHDRARDEIKKADKARILIIEDEAFISMHLSCLVEDLEHSVTAIARTRDEAVDAVRQQEPTLILSDIQLADGSSGIDAVDDISKDCDAPAIFITAYPDRLLTGQRTEPLFLINKPFSDNEVSATVSQAIYVAGNTRH